MTVPGFSEIIAFAAPCWLVNLSLNSLYIAKVIFPGFSRYDQPLDGGKNFWDKKRILGNSTTIAGIFIALPAGLIISHLLERSLWEGFLSGALVYSGHALGSFIKRRANFSDGEYMPFVDHADYIIATGIVFGVTGLTGWNIIISSILLTYIVHPVITFLAHKLGLHEKPL